MSFRELFERFNIEAASDDHEHSRSGWTNVDCPYCGVAGHFRLGFNEYGKYCNCWACGRHVAYRALVDLGVPAKEAFQYLKEHRPGDDSVSTKSRRVSVAGKVSFPDGIEDMSAPHVFYLESRDLDAEKIARLWGIRGIGRHGGALSWRLWIPIHYRGEIVSWSTRDIHDNHKLRYWTASHKEEKIHHKDILYGEDYARHSIIVCEGPIDVWKIGPGAVCTFGTSFTTPQLRRIAQFPQRTIIYDNEPEAQKRATELYNLLIPFSGRTNKVILHNVKDPGELGRGMVADLRRHFLT